MPIDTAVLSLTPVCNLQCRYCQNEPPFRGYPKRPMDPQVLRNVIASYRALVVSQGGDTIRFTFSGGEPLLTGRKYFDTLLALQNEIIGSDLKIQNTVQTNGTLIDADWARLFRDRDFCVSVTIDGPRSVHNSQRPARMNDGNSLDLALRGIEILRTYGVRFGILTVVSSNSVGRAREIFEFLAALKPNMIGFLPCVDRGPMVSPAGFGQFMIDAFDAWIDARNPQLLVREFAHVVQGMLGVRHTKGCQYGGDCPRHINVAPDGSVSVCDQFIGKPGGYLGNVMTTSLSEIVDGEAFNGFRDKVHRLPANCENCRYLALCNGGCSYRRAGFTSVDYLCEGRKMFFAHIERRLDSMLAAMMSRLPRADDVESFASA